MKWRGFLGSANESLGWEVFDECMNEGMRWLAARNVAMGGRILDVCFLVESFFIPVK